jgi:CheY-like chemotaxis protein
MHAEGNSCLAIVVEDEWVVRMQIGDILLDAGWDVQEFAAGELALDYLETCERVHLLVCDIRLSGQVTGWQVAQAYRGRYPEMRVIYCSGNEPDEHQRVSDSVFLPKPCNMEHLRGG